jgi:hypothetical protein
VYTHYTHNAGYARAGACSGCMPLFYPRAKASRVHASLWSMHGALSKARASPACTTRICLRPSGLASPRLASSVNNRIIWPRICAHARFASSWRRSGPAGPPRVHRNEAAAYTSIDTRGTGCIGRDEATATWLRMTRRLAGRAGGRRLAGRAGGRRLAGGGCLVAAAWWRLPGGGDG